MAVIGLTETARLGTRMSPCRGLAGRRWESSDRVIPGKDMANLDQADPQAVSKLGQGACRSLTALIDGGAGPPLIGKEGDMVADVGGELPVAAAHGDLLQDLGLLVEKTR